MSRLFGFSPLWRLITIGALILLLLIPLLFVRSLVTERSTRYHEAVAEITGKWGEDQSLAGPMIAIPYTALSGRTEKGNPLHEERTAYFLPDDLVIAGTLEAETRRRSIYEAVLYSVDLDVHGSFRLPSREQFESATTAVHWNRAYLIVGVSDTRGIKDDITLEWQGRKTSFLPGTNGSSLYATGLHSPVAIAAAGDAKKGHAPFAFRLRLLGSSSLRFLPAGKSTHVTMDSSWQNPGFTGAMLPSKREINERGFHAEWNVSYYGRSYGQAIMDPGSSEKTALSSSEFGFELVQMVDHYQKTERATKYGILFLLLTFTAFFLFEIFTGLRIHPIQYLMVGSAMVLFYLLFLSLSEHTGFLVAYVASAAATTGMISGYSAVVLQGHRRAATLAAFLSVLYGYLYVVMSSEDSALLLGSIALFALLSGTMFLTRKIDWYTVGRPGSEQPPA